MYYIRCLKSPKYDDATGTLKTLITITTDLGDDFYPDNLVLYATLVKAEHEKGWQAKWQTVEWKSGMRTAWIEFKSKSFPPGLLQLIVNARPSLSPDIVRPDDLPEVLSARIDVCRPGLSKGDINAGRRIERRYRTYSEYETVIYEESGESIARHIWDAGVALAAYMSSIMTQLDLASSLAVKIRSTSTQGLKVLELGSGCGIAGLQVAQVCPMTEILMTDVAEAMDLLKYNVERAKSASKKANIATAILEWEEPLPHEIAQSNYDLVIVSDCTYNADSIPSLVKTLTALTTRSPDALVVVSMKVRHESESVFHVLMAASQLKEVDHIRIPFPDRTRTAAGQALEVIDIHIFAKDETI